MDADKEVALVVPSDDEVNFDINEISGLGIESENRDERIRSRRSRIRQRVEAERRREQGLADEEVAIVENQALNPDPIQSNARIAEAHKSIDLLHEQGMEKVTLVRIAADHSEAKRRREEEKIRTERREKLKALQEETIEMTRTVSSRWDVAAAKVDVVELDNELSTQRELCDSIVKEKDDMVTQLQTALKAKDDEYVRNLRAQAADIDTIIAYMNDQVKTLTRSYRQELEMIEEAFMRERQELLIETKREWDEAMKMRREKELSAIEELRNRIDDQEHQLEYLRINDSEEYSQIKRRLEKDITKLQQELQNMRATYQLNTEKLEYNYQVLKKRDEENTVTISSQKRRLNKLQDVVNGLKTKLKKQEQQMQIENMTLTEEYTKSALQFQDLQKKAKYFADLNKKRKLCSIEDVWVLNEEQCTVLAKDLLDADRIIHEQQLGLQWVAPLEDVFNSTLSEQDLQSRKASAIARELMDGQDIVTEYDDIDTGHLSQTSMRHILSHICDEAGFLVESKLSQLLAPLNPKEQMLMKLDAIFKALHVETKDDMKTLMKYFIAHADERETKDGMPTLIDPTHVPAALRRFVEDQRKAKGLDESLQPSRGLKDRDPNFWDRLKRIVPDSHDKTYASLMEGLEKYRDTLVGRKKLMERREALTTQNQELRQLLQTYIGSQVNRELEIPPTQLLHGKLTQHHISTNLEP
eukprot:gene7715-612_t